MCCKDKKENTVPKTCIICSGKSICNLYYHSVRLLDKYAEEGLIVGEYCGIFRELSSLCTDFEVITK